MKKALFIDRDGTVIAEPPADYQVDSLEKLEFIPGAISAPRTHGAGFRTSDGDEPGRGWARRPSRRRAFRPPQKMLRARSQAKASPSTTCLSTARSKATTPPTRKPRTGMFGRYTDGSYDFGASYVVGDRATDIPAGAQPRGEGHPFGACRRKGAGCCGKRARKRACVLITDSWAEIAEYIRRGERRVVVTRETRETRITVRIDLDGRGFGTCGPPRRRISTGLRFLDHMLTQIAHHGGGVAHGGGARRPGHRRSTTRWKTWRSCWARPSTAPLGSKAGIGRYGFALPMDDCRALVLLDFGGRIDFEWDAEFRRERVGDVPTEMFRHFFHSLCCAARCNLQISARGGNDHHKAEAIFKAFARALRMAVARTGFRIRHTQQQRHTMIAITDYDTGNLRSVANALRRIGARFTVTSDAAVLRQADRVLPRAWAKPRRQWPNSANGDWMRSSPP